MPALIKRTRTPPAQAALDLPVAVTGSTEEKISARPVRRAPIRIATAPIVLPVAPSQDVDRTAERARAAEEQLSYERIIDEYVSRIRNPMTAIRARCVQCCSGQPSEVRKCTAVTCALHPFRMGTNPHNAKVKNRLAMEDAGSEDNGEDE